jgi:hypothetical protein
MDNTLVTFLETTDVKYMGSSYSNNFGGQLEVCKRALDCILYHGRGVSKNQIIDVYNIDTNQETSLIALATAETMHLYDSSKPRLSIYETNKLIRSYKQNNKIMSYVYKIIDNHYKFDRQDIVMYSKVYDIYTNVVNETKKQHSRGMNSYAIHANFIQDVSKTLFPKGFKVLDDYFSDMVALVFDRVVKDAHRTWHPVLTAYYYHSIITAYESSDDQKDMQLIARIAANAVLIANGWPMMFFGGCHDHDAPIKDEKLLEFYDVLLREIKLGTTFNKVQLSQYLYVDKYINNLLDIYSRLFITTVVKR